MSEDDGEKLTLPSLATELQRLEAETAKASAEMEAAMERHLTLCFKLEQARENLRAAIDKREPGEVRAGPGLVENIGGGARLTLHKAGQPMPPARQPHDFADFDPDLRRERPEWGCR